jgi:hypothetical protein
MFYSPSPKYPDDSTLTKKGRFTILPPWPIQ